jgi:hypothetical protein
MKLLKLFPLLFLTTLLAAQQLPPATSATTQTSGDNSTKVATDAFVNTAAANLQYALASQSTLLAQYNMTDTGGSNGFTLTDSSGNGNNGSLGLPATITNVSKSGSTLTVTCANNFTAGYQVTFYGVGTNTVLNGQVLTISATGLSTSQFEVTSFSSSITNGADTGTAVSQFPTWITSTTPTINTNQLQVSGGLQFTSSKGTFAALPAAINTVKTILLVTYFDPANFGVEAAPFPFIAGGIAAQYPSSVRDPGIAVVGSSYNPGGYNNYYWQGFNTSGGYSAANFPPIHGYQVLSWVINSGGDEMYSYTRPWAVGMTIGAINSSDNPYYQLGGNAAASGNPTWFQGQILFAAFWSSALTPAQVAQNVQAVQGLMQARGLVLNGVPGQGFQALPGTWQIPESIDTFALDGDSETTYISSSNLPTVTGSPNIFNTGQSGQTALTINTNSAYMVDVNIPNQAFNSSIVQAGAGANRAGVIVFVGTNDAVTSNDTAAIALGSLAGYCRARKKAGWNKVATLTMMDRSGVTTFKDSYDALMRQNWANWADMLIDVAANPNWGADGANANTFYMTSGVHWSTTVSLQMAGWFYSYGMRRMYGNTHAGGFNVATSSPYLVQPEDIFFEANDSSAISAYLIPAQMFTGQTVTVANVGTGTLTLYPKPITATITNFALTSNVATVTAANNYTAGDVVVFAGLTTNPTLNGASCIVLSASLSSSSFGCNYTHANITSATETGTALLANYTQLGAITNIAETSGNVVTLTVSNNYATGETIHFSGLTTGTWLNGQSASITTASSTSIIFTDPTSHGTQASAAETGITQYNYPAETINGNSSLTVAAGTSVKLLSTISAAATGLANWTAVP